MENLTFGFKSLLKGPKIIFVILGGVLLIEVLYAMMWLSTPVPVSPEPASPKKVSIGLYSSSSEFRVKEAVPVVVRIDTGSREAVGVDLVLSFDPKILEATAGAVAKGAIYPEYPQTKIDAKAGLIQVSGISGLEGENFKGSGVFATINFKAKAVGETTLMVNHAPGKTDDSNVVEALSGNDILERVSNLTVIVQ